MIEQLKKIEFHDRDIQSLRFDFDERKIAIRVDVNESDHLDKEYIDLLFLEVDNLLIRELSVNNNDFMTLEINSCTIDSCGDYYKVSFVLLLGSGKPSSELSFDFVRVEIK